METQKTTNEHEHQKTTITAASILDSPELTKNISWLKYALLPLEFSCLIILFKNQKPTSTGGIYAQFLMLLVKRHEIGGYSKSMDGSIDLRVVEQRLREQGHYFPSYPKVQNTLEQLEKAGLVSRRDMEGMREKFLWMISPAFYLKHGKAFEAAFLRAVPVREKGTFAKRYQLTELYQIELA